ncbi:MAG: hypothetical protein K2J69_01655 [Malacoplasma sp.]|nr:hypothetical protein [Malacoplasma sp.]
MSVDISTAAVVAGFTPAVAFIPVEPTYVTAPSDDNFTLQFVLYTMNDKGLNDYFKNRISSSQYEGFVEKIS